MNPAEKIRVAHIITTFSMGGATENTLLTVAGLVQSGAYDVDVIAGTPNKAEGALLDQAAAFGVEVDVIPSLKREIGPADDIRAFRVLSEKIRDGRYDIVHTHSAKAGILGRLAAYVQDVPVVAHTYHGMVYSPNEPLLKRMTYNVLENLASRVTTGHTSVTFDLIRKVERAGIIKHGQCVCARSGMDLDRFLHPKPERDAIRAAWGVPEDAVVMGTIGRVHTGKGQDVLVDLAPRLCEACPDLRIVIIGTGPLSEPLQEKVRAQGLADKVIFPGSFPPEEMPEVISSLDMLIHVSEREGLARVIVQSLACGKPVISYDLDGSPEVITDRVNGRLLPPHDPEAVYQAVAELARDADLRARWGAMGPPAVNPAFRAEMMVRQIADEYEHLLKKVGRRYPVSVEIPLLDTWQVSESE